MADSGLSSFNLEVHQGTGSRQQLRDAAVATNEARKQVVAVVKQAQAWRERGRGRDRGGPPGAGGPHGR